MKIKDGFILRTISKETVVIPMESDLDLNMMIKLHFIKAIKTVKKTSNPH